MKRNSAPITVEPKAVHGLIDHLLWRLDMNLRKRFPGRWPPSPKIEAMTLESIYGSGNVMSRSETQVPLWSNDKPHLSGAHLPLKLLLVAYVKKLDGVRSLEGLIMPDGITVLRMPKDVNVNHVITAVHLSGHHTGLHDALYNVLVHEIAHLRDPGGPMGMAPKRWRGEYLDDPSERVAFKTEIFHECAAKWDEMLAEVRETGGTRMDAFKGCLEESQGWEVVRKDGSPEAQKDILKSVYQGFVKEGWLP